MEYSDFARILEDDFEDDVIEVLYDTFEEVGFPQCISDLRFYVNVYDDMEEALNCAGYESEEDLNDCLFTINMNNGKIITIE